MSQDGRTQSVGSEDDENVTSSTSKTKGGRTVRHRKSHMKSKQGCYDCKARRIKCDEAKPSCQNCDKKGLRCEYPKPTARPITFAEPVILSPSSMTTERKSAKNQKPARGAEPAAEMRLIQRRRGMSPLLAHQVNWPDVQLVHNFDTQASKALMVPIVWREAFSDIAMKYDFAISALLMFSAGHMARQTQGPSQHTYRVQELEYREMALQRMRDQLTSRISSVQDHDALLGTSIILACHSCSFSRFESLDPCNDAFLHMLNGVKQIVKNMWNLRHSSRFKKLFTMQFAPEPDETLRYGFENLFVVDEGAEGSSSTAPKLPAVNWETETKYLPDYHIYRRVLASLLPLLHAVYGQEGYIAADPDSGTFLCLVSWPMLQPDRFFSMLRESDPKALILAAHYYAALLKLDPGASWWLYDRPREMCRAICYKLGPTYRPHLQLPLDMLDSVDGNPSRQPSPDGPDGPATKWYKPNIPLKKPQYTALERQQLTISGRGENNYPHCEG